MKKGDLVIFRAKRGFSLVDGMLGVLLKDSYVQDGYEVARVYFPNAPKGPERIISIECLRMVNEKR